MKSTNPRHLIAENERWKRELKCLEDEVIHFKNRLIHMLKTGLHKDELESLEYFQNSFLKMDEQIRLLRHEVREQLFLLGESFLSSGQQLKRIIRLQVRLEVQMLLILEDFRKLKRTFNDYQQEMAI